VDEHHEPDRDDPRARLHQLLTSLTGLASFLDQLAVVAAERVITPEASVGITVLRDGRPTTVSNSDLRASQVDEIQYSEGVGPCLHALRTQEVVLLDDVFTDDRWPEFTSRATAHGVRSVLSLPFAAPDLLGALNVYASDESVFDEAAQARGQQFSGEVQRAMELAVQLSDQLEMTQQLRAALASRSTIDQAIGVIMGQDRCNAAEAYAVIRSASQNRNVKLRDVAMEIVMSVGGKPSADPTFS
jgi:AmiR/NasT family two-component response regulator